jgi:E3 ubiquitin-protein ligase synoviolin
MRKKLVAGTLFGAYMFQMSRSNPAGTQAWIDQVLLKWSIPTLYKSSIFVALMLARFTQAVLFGPLQGDELPRLTSQSLYTLAEFAVAFVMVREPVSIAFLVNVVLFVLVKWFHALSANRVERFTPRERPWKRLTLALSLLHVIDVFWIVRYFQIIVIEGQRSMLQLIFGFEASILYNGLIWTSGHLLISQLQLQPKNHRLYVISLIALSSCIQLVLYFFFSMIMLSNFCVPLHIFRESYSALRVSVTRIREIIWYRRLTETYDISSFKRATKKDLQDSPLCIICRDAMSEGQYDGPESMGEYMSHVKDDYEVINQNVPVKIKCSHIIHYDCLFEWLQQSNKCPTCRSLI